MTVSLQDAAFIILGIIVGVILGTCLYDVWREHRNRKRLASVKQWEIDEINKLNRRKLP